MVAMVRSRTRRPVWVAALFLGVVLAGCLGGETEGFAEGPTEDANRGRLIGKVTDVELRPVLGANITFEEAEELRAVTGQGGTFNVSLAPGTYQMLVEAPGFFRHRQDVSVEIGAATEVHVQLEQMPSQVPYVGMYPMAGYSVCDISAFIVVTTWEVLTGQPCPLGDPVWNLIQAVDEAWQYAVIEMTWETADSFALYVAEDQNCLTSNPCYGIVFAGTPPARIDIAPEDAELAARYASDGEDVPPAGAWEMWANVLYIGMYQEQWGGVTSDPICRGLFNYQPGCPSWGVSTGIPFDVYVSIFNWERPANPNAYTAIPDA